MAKTYEELLAGATQIKNNELPESNTHSLVGGQLVDMVEKQKEDSERIDNVSKSHKGYFQTLEQLKAKYPTPKEGETAWVGEPYPGNVYDVVDGAWHDTGVPANEGGGSGTSNYNDLENKPSIGNVSLEGDKTLDELGIASKESLSAKVNVELGKGLSANDYTTNEKEKLGKIEEGATKNVVDTDFSLESENSLQNKKVTEAINEIKKNIEGILGINTKFVGYYESQGNLPSVSEESWAFVGNLNSVSVYAYYTYIVGNYTKGWNKLSSIGTYNFENFNDFAKSIVETNSNIDLSISDGKGHNIAEFFNGHFRTKKFDSQKVPQSGDHSSDLSLSDEFGYDIARFKNGHIKTKNFDSERIINLNGIKIVFLGDSITFGYLVESNEVYHAVLSQISGCISKNLGVSSTGLCTNMKNNMSNQRFITRVTEENLKDQDLIVIFGGTNDFSYDNKAIGSVFVETTISSDTYIGTKKLVPTSDTDTFDGAMHELIAEIRSITSVPIIFITPLKRGRYSSGRPTSSETNTNGNYLKDYSDTIKKVCEFYSIPVLDLFSNSNLDLENERISELYSEDSLHPNAAGHRVIAELLLKFIYTNIKL